MRGDRGRRSSPQSSRPDRDDGRKAVVADIDDGRPDGHGRRQLIMQPFGDRSGLVIEPMLTDQWYVDAETLAKPAIEAVQDGRHRDRPGDLEEDLVQLAGEHSTVVRVAPALVGPPHSRLGTPRTAACSSPRRRKRRRSSGRRAAAPGRGRARHLVLARPCGRSRRSAGPRRPTTSSATIPMTSSSPASTSSSSGTRAWRCRASSSWARRRGRRSTSTASSATPRARRCPSRRAIRSTRSA